MNGVAFYRRKRQYSREKLAELAGICKDTIRNYELRGITDFSEVESLLALAKALDVSLDELVAEHDERELSTVDRTVRPSNIDSPRNCVSNYRRAKNLRYQELADLLGLASREGARHACRRSTARSKHVARLAQYEGISTAEFMVRYARSDVQKVK